MVVFSDCTGPDTKSSVDRGGERSSPLHPQHYVGISRWDSLAHTHRVESNSSYSGHIAFASSGGHREPSMVRRNDAPSRSCSHLNSGTSGKFLCGTKNSFHLVMRCSCRFCTFAKGDEDKLPTQACKLGSHETTFHSSLVSRSSSALSLASISGHPLCHVASALKPQIARALTLRRCPTTFEYLPYELEPQCGSRLRDNVITTSAVSQLPN